jgi:hypothetical protein
MQFGWTADEDTAFQILTAAVDAGINLLTQPISIHAGQKGIRVESPNGSSVIGSRKRAFPEAIW